MFELDAEKVLHVRSLLTLESLISLASRAAELFERSKPEQKHELLAFVFSNLRLKGKKLVFFIEIAVRPGGQSARSFKLAEEAVLIGPVSNPKFPANREKNREFCRFGRRSYNLAAIQPLISKVCSKFPTNRTGNFLERTGNFLQRTGKFDLDL